MRNFYLVLHACNHVNVNKLHEQRKYYNLSKYFPYLAQQPSAQGVINASVFHGRETVLNALNYVLINAPEHLIKAKIVCAPHCYSLRIVISNAR